MSMTTLNSGETVASDSDMRAPRFPFRDLLRPGTKCYHPSMLVLKTLRSVLLLATLLLAVSPVSAADPDYRLWQELLSKHYDPAKGMNYKGLKTDKAALDRLRGQLAAVDVGSLSRPEQLAYWINLYNVNVVGVVVDNYPVESIRDISTDPIVRLNVFKKPYV